MAKKKGPFLPLIPGAQIVLRKPKVEEACASG